MTPDPTINSSATFSSAFSSTPAPPVTADSILATLESALAELTDLAVLIDTAKAAEEQLLKLFELYKRQTLSPAGLPELTKAVQVLYRLTSIRKTLILTVTSLIDRHASPKEAQTQITQTLIQLRAQSPLLPAGPTAAPDPQANKAGADKVAEVGEIGELGGIDEVGEVDDPEIGMSDEPEELSEGPAGTNLNSPRWSSPERSEGERNLGEPTQNARSPEGANLPAPRPDSTPNSDADTNTSPLKLSPHSAFRTPHSSVRQVCACPYLPGLTESELARLVLYIGSLQAWENRRQLWLRTPRRPPIWHPPAWGGFKLENTRPLSFPTKCFDPNFDPCRPATWPPEMIAAEYRREIPFFPSYEYLGPIPPDPSAAEPPSADPRPTAPPPTAPSWVGDSSRQADAPIEDDWDAEDEWDEDESWDDSSDAPHSSGPPDPG